MKKISIAVFASTLAATLACPVVHAQESAPLTVTVGLKLWSASWSSYLPATYAGVDGAGRPTLGQSFDTADGARRTNVLPLLVLRKGNYFISGSYGSFSTDFHVQSTSIPVAPTTNLVTSRTDHFERREGDIAAGYFITPELALSLGYKQVDEERDTALGVAPQSAPFLKNRGRGILLGAAGSFPVVDKLRLYTTAGYGPARTTTRFADPTLSSIDSNGRYLIGEVGLSYTLFQGAAWPRAVSAALGYRTQTVKTDGSSPFTPERRQLRDVRDGVVLSINMTL